jgi:predicted ATPase
MKPVPKKRKVIVLTGGPCGGKTSLIREIFDNPFYKDKFVYIPEAVIYVLQTKTSPNEKIFQKLMVEVQFAMENALDKCFDEDKIFICHRGSLDPLAYWQYNNWKDSEFFTFTQSNPSEHYGRYHAIIHLQTVAINAIDYYKQYPLAHRHETAEESSKLDNLLANNWKGHPGYHFIESHAEWEVKRNSFYQVLNSISNISESDRKVNS